MHSVNIPDTDQKRIVIIGAGFAGLTLAQALNKTEYQVVLIDKNNYHQFQPLFYQVAMSGLEPGSICFPLRKIFQKSPNIFIRVSPVDAIDRDRKEIITQLGTLKYDYLVIAIGASTNFFGNDVIQGQSIPMKSVSEALYLRNAILDDYEKAITTTDYDNRQGLIDIAIVGGGPTGVEVAGALAEMKKYILPKDYREINPEEIDIYLIQGDDRLLPGMSEAASAASEKFLTDLGVIVLKNKFVVDIDDEYVYMNDGTSVQARKVIWAAGIKGNPIKGLPKDSLLRNNRIAIDEYFKIKGTNDIYAIGDIAAIISEAFPNGHPQVAPVAIQQAQTVAKNFKRMLKEQEIRAFKYKDKGSMATIGRNRAVVDLKHLRMKGFLAWVIWMLVHLFSLIGIKNRLFVLINWVWSYFTYDQSLRLIIRPRIKPYEPFKSKDSEFV